MDLDKFLDQVIYELLKKFGNGYSIKKHTKNGINGTVQHALVIEQLGTNIHPCIYVDDCYERYIHGECLDDVVNQIYSSYSQNVINEQMDMSFFTRWDTVRANVRCKLINTEKNTDFLQTVPHREYLDLSLVYYVYLPEFNSSGSATIQILNEHMAQWNIDEYILYDMAWENIRKLNNVVFGNLESILYPFIDMSTVKNSSKNPIPPLYLLSNKEKSNGAVQMCNTDILSEISNFLEDDFWILPSSTHEVLILPVDYKKDSTSIELAQMVEYVNDSQLELDEILSYHVYRYRRDTKQVEIAA